MTNGSEDLRLWDAVADSYAATVSGPGDSFYRRIHGFLWGEFGDVSGLDVLDLGCGHGWLAERMRQAGARVTGIDGSDGLLAIARARYPDIEFRGHDLTLGLPDPARRFDRVVAHMVLMDVPVLDRLFADVAGSLRDGGVFVFSILHPAFFSRDIVDEGPDGERYRKVTGYLAPETRWIESFGGHRHYHRPLSWYAELAIANGLVITGIHEPPSLPHTDIPPAEWTDYQRWFSTIPTTLAISCAPSARSRPTPRDR
ncbi:class I SAM-dependent DNA methyltransferase [Nocardia takedensis]|uniref:class I SAM-dependent DNA methyltransferase n=1 Tax=Nocardia takedensis TaxID=259390 RepID=UPI0002FCB142|nr:class I SAM-dependent methyltransferase [Nocardia takedensis]